MGCNSSSSQKYVSQHMTRPQQKIPQLSSIAKLEQVEGIQHSKVFSADLTAATQTKPQTSGSFENQQHMASILDAIKFGQAEEQSTGNPAESSNPQIIIEEEIEEDIDDEQSVGNENIVTNKVISCKDIKMLDYMLKNLQFNFMNTYKNTYIDRYKYCSFIGKGAAGEVYLAKGPVFCRAVKVPIKDDHKYSKFLQNEIKLISKLDHPNILRPIELNTENNKSFAIFEYLKGGSLEDCFTCRIYKDQRNVAYTIRQILYVINYLHNQGIVHRDIKHQNIVFDEKPGGKLKLIDFGTCVKLQKGQKLSSCCGTVLYMAPEVLQGKYDHKCDVWSVGVILYTLLAKSFPYTGIDFEDAKQNILNKRIYFGKIKKLNPSACDLLSKLLVKDPEKRISATKALQHSFLRESECLNETFDLYTYDSLIKATQQQKSITAIILSGLAARHGRHVESRSWAVELFENLDSKKKGFITYLDLVGPQERIGSIDEDEVIEKLQNSFHNINLSRSGQISYTELLVSMVDLGSELVQDELCMIFDESQKGKIDRSIVRDKIMHHYRGKYTDLFDEFKQFQLIGNEKMNYRQFKNILSGIQ